MAVIIGAGTTVGGIFGNECVISVNWAYNPNVQRAYCLGEWTPDENRTIRRPTYTLSATLYSSGTTPTYDTTPSESCVNEATTIASVSPAACAGSVASINYSDWVITSYGYSKDDPQGYAQESWSLQRWDGTAPAVAPTYIIRMISEGSVNTEVQADAGIVFSGVTETGSQGSVSAGGIGKADSVITGVVSQVGGSTSTQGKVGSGNVSIPYTPLWI